MAAPTPARRLSQRRGSISAPDPFGVHDVPAAASGSSRITIVRVPTVKDSSVPGPTPPSPGATYHSRDRESGSSLARRSSWGSNKSGSSDFGSGSGGAGGGRGRMSFAFASFTPIHPPSGPAVLDRGGAVTPTSSGPPSPSSFRSQRRSFSNPAQAQPVPRAQPLTPQQLYEVAQQATNPSQAGSSSPKYGYGGAPIPASQVSTQGGGPAPFVPLPNEVYLPFINRPQEVQQLLSTPQTSRLFALLASTFPQESTGGSTSRPSSSMSVRTAGGTPLHSSSQPQYALDEVPKDPREWSFSHLSFWLRHVTRPEAPDREWIHAIRVCVNSRSEVLWQRFAGALGVPPGFEEEEEESALVDEDEFLEGDERPVGVGRTTKGPAAAALKERTVDVASETAESEAADEGEYFAGEELDFEEEYDPSSLPGSEAMIEPITASSLPPPPGPANPVSSPGEGLGLTPNESHSLEGVTEEEEPEEESPPASSPAPTSEDPILHTLPSSSSSSSISKTFLGPGGQYAPKTHSPLAGDPTKPEPILNVIEPSPKLGEEEEQEDPEIDFPAEPDPNAEPIQGIRIMNAPMTLFPSTSEEAVSSSPLTYTPPHTSQPVSPPRSGGSGVVAETGVLRPRTGSNSSFRAQLLSGGRLGERVPAHQRTQSFGAYGLHARKGGGSASHSPLSGGPHFPGSFAGLGTGSHTGAGGPTGPAMLLRNPRAPPGGRPAGISLGAGMHYTPRSGRAPGAGVLGGSALESDWSARTNLSAISGIQQSVIQPGLGIPFVPQPLNGKLLREERVTYGQQSELYKGVWAVSDHDYKPVALKSIELRRATDEVRAEQVLRRIVRETFVWANLKHPNIVPFYGYQQMGEGIVLVSRWYEKQSLDIFLGLYPELTLIDKLELVLEAACGLAYLHSLDPQIVHVGVQPKNIIITHDLRAAWSDVGLSRVMTDLGVRTGLTTGGQAVEFAGFQARELLNEDPPTPMSDVYAFGGVILSTLSGKNPFWRKRSSAIVIAIFAGKAPDPADHPTLPASDSIWKTLTKCWNIDPERRPSMIQVVEQLKGRISECGESRRARADIPIVEEETESSRPQLSVTTDILTPSLPGEPIFQSGAPIRDLIPQLKLEGTLAKIEKVGSGGYGDVFQGVWKKSDDEVVLVAIKSIRGSVVAEKKVTETSGEADEDKNDFLTRIIRETTIWKVAQHPNILSFYGYQIVGEEAMLVSQWCKNGSLDSYIDKHKELKDTQKLKLLCDAARGLAYLHSRQPPIAHGDIKPQNVIITDKIEAALCDFGIARVMSDFTTGVTTRNPGAGTIRYQAKELLLDASQPTNMSDLYAFGGLILATMSGKAPFHQHKSNTPVILAITQGKNPQPADHLELKQKDPLWNLLTKCWMAEPGRRPSAGQVTKTLEAEIRRRSGIKS